MNQLYQSHITLVELADVDHLLGFKGNYIIFTLLESNALTDFIMVPYINKYSGIADPDSAANMVYAKARLLPSQVTQRKC